MRRLFLGALLASLFALLIGGWNGVKAFLGPSAPKPASTVDPYTARTDFAVIPVPNTVPSMGDATGAGNSALDPDFNTRIYRLTDINTVPHARYATLQDWHMNCGGWGAWRVSNLDSTKLFVCHNGGRALLLPFNPSTGKPGPAQELPPGVGGFPEWSKTEKDVAFSLATSRSPEIMRLDFSGSSPKATSVVNLAKAPNCAQELSGSAMWMELSVSWDDATFVVAASKGIQDTAHLIFVWNAKTGCQTYDTQAGIVNGSPVTGATDRFLVHGVMISGDGKTVVITPMASDRLRHFWHIGTTQVEAYESDLDYGHFATGYDAYLSGAGRSSDGRWCKLGMAIWSLNALTAPDYLLGPKQCANTLAAGENHVSWNNDDSTDKQPFATSTTAGPGGTPITAPWQDEVLVFGLDGTVHREAHTFNSGKSKFFACQFAIGSISNDGKWFFFSSDWEGTLGKDLANNMRCDDFAVQLH
jgi:hypothetical protein